LTELEKVSQKKIYKNNKIIFQEGDASDAFYIINKGHGKAVIMDENGKEITLNVHGPDEYFGEMALIDNEPRSATIITKDQAEFTVIRREDFRKMVLSKPEMAINLLKGMSSRLRNATEKIENLAFLDVYGRIKKVLDKYATSENGEQIIKEKFTHQDIANLVGSSREMVSRIMKELVDGGYITIDKKLIRILKKIPQSF